MHDSLQEAIRALSKSDKKSLTQKTLKLVEEVGELAKVVLPFENAFATTHRFVDQERLLEEIADTYLVLMSLVYDLNLSEDDLVHMVTHKMKYWADLQAREGRVSYPIPYEIHITVALPDSMSVGSFRDACKVIGVKPIFLDLALRSGGVLKDVMTSSVIMSDNAGAYREAKRISEALQNMGFAVLREKIETVPWHPAAPSATHTNSRMPPSCYFESHLNVICSSERESLLDSIAQAHGAHKSRNIFKRHDDGTFTIMVTYRNSAEVFEEFQASLQRLKTAIVEGGFLVPKEIVEFSIYDTKVSHDAAWLTTKASTT